MYNEYYPVKEDITHFNAEDKRQTLLTFWEQLKGITQLTFHAKTKSKDPHGWKGKGKGDVTITKQSGRLLIFNEKGSWLDKQESEVGFSNVFRWSLDREAGVVSLEHLRRGPDHPVFLFHLAPSGKHSLSSVDSHLCGGDTYFANIHFDPYSFHLNWRVIGPKKNEEIDYCYS